MTNFLLAINLLILLISAFNVLTVRTVKSVENSEISDHVSILIPLRNESENVEALMQSLANQEALNSYEIIALDDNSTDDTAEKLHGISIQNLKTITGEPLPQGWLGKNFACHQLAKSAKGDYLVFVDADVRLAKNAIADSIHLMRRLEWDFLSPYPQQIAKSFLERLTQPLLQWSWFASLPLRLAEKLQTPSMVVANGQFLIVKKDAYNACGGHEAVKSEVLDDMELARTLTRKNFRGGVADGSKIATCRMYSKNSDLIEGYTKSQWRAFGNPFGALIVCLILFCTSVLPFLLGITGDVYGWYAYFSIVMSRVIVAAKTRSVISSASLHPISALVWIYLIIHSWFKKKQGTLTWRGREL